MLLLGGSVPAPAPLSSHLTWALPPTPSFLLIGELDDKEPGPALGSRQPFPSSAFRWYGRPGDTTVSASQGLSEAWCVHVLLLICAETLGPRATLPSRGPRDVCVSLVRKGLNYWGIAQFCAGYLFLVFGTFPTGCF